MHYDKNNTEPSKMRWGTYDNRQMTIGQVEDMHLANILVWVKSKPTYYSFTTFLEIEREANRRKLKPEFLAGAPYPHKNEHGQWIQFINDKPTVIGR